MKTEKTTKCNDERKCFAKEYGGCLILDAPYPKGKPCPFCKPVRSVTKGKKYS